MSPSDHPVCFLFDNGSLRADSTRRLRAVATELAGRLGVGVHAVSLLHSSAVSPEQLDGERARLLEPALDAWFATGPATPVIALPLFFGPSAALTSYVPERVAALKSRHPAMHVCLAACLVDSTDAADTRIASILADRVRAVIEAQALERPTVVLVDHGSPQPAVAEVRNHLGRQLGELLRDEAADVRVASMERREGDAYAFNEPLLAAALAGLPASARDVVICLQFLSPGRHAGANGDIVAICKEAEAARPGLRTHLTDTLAGDGRLVAVLADRYLAAVAQSGFLGSIKPTSSA